LFQPHQYISVDYSRQDGVVISVSKEQQIGLRPLITHKQEPLAAQWKAFLEAVEERREPVVGAAAAIRALEVCLDILDKIEVHAGVVNQTLADRGY
jgi:predicted dehydrogenase